MNTRSSWRRASSVPLDSGWWNDLQVKLQDKIPAPLDQLNDDFDAALAKLEKQFAELHV